MAAPKVKPSHGVKLFTREDKEKNLKDKQIVESLQERLNERIQKNPELVKKAAAILEEWLKIKPKK
jgi:hypothetical protein